ncbi:MAG: restriction endonuclease [Bacteroidota bacterium]
MTKFVIDTENDFLSIDGNKFELIEVEVAGNKYLICETELKALQSVNLSVFDYPINLTIDVDDETGFDTYLFHKLSISKSNNFMVFDFECSQPNKYWEGTWGLSTFLAALSDSVKTDGSATVELMYLDGDWKELTIRFVTDKNFNFKSQIEEYSTILKRLIRDTELTLAGGAVWRKEYETTESLFCTEILYPLLRKMGYIDVRYTHGKKEYGKDFTFSEQTKFGNLRHFGLQAKAGNLRGNVNADIDEIIGQLNDAFGMPYHEVSANENRQISTFIVAISGQYTENAKEKIINKIPKHFLGSVYFIDRDKIIELVEKYWR